MSPERFISLEPAQYPKRLIVFFDLDNTLFNTKRFKETDRQCYEVYDDVPSSLGRLAGSIPLGLLSLEKERGLQDKKLFRTGIGFFFTSQHVFIVQDKKQVMQEILAKYSHKDVMIVDDKLDVLATAKEIDPKVTTVWVRRGEYADSQADIPVFQPDLTVPDITSLADALLEPKIE